MKEFNKDCACESDYTRHGNCEDCQGNHKDGMTTCQRLQKEKDGK